MGLTQSEFHMNDSAPAVYQVIKTFDDLPKGFLIPKDKVSLYGIQEKMDQFGLYMLNNRDPLYQDILILATEEAKKSLSYRGLLKKLSSQSGMSPSGSLDKKGPDKTESFPLDRPLKIVGTAVINADMLRALYERQQFDDEEQKEGEKDNNQVIDKVRRLVHFALMNSVSDIHIEKRKTSAKIRMRKHGQLMDYSAMAPSDATKMCSVIYQVMAESKDLQYSEEDYQAASINLNLSGEEVKLRYQSLPVYPQGFDVVMRVLPIGTDDEEFVSLQSLGYSDSQMRQLLRIVSRPVGALIIAGTTGSGKSTTLKNLLMFVNASRGYRCKIFTVEDPPEYKIPRVSQIPVIRRKKDEEAYRYKSPFEDPLTATMRADPDILMIGEIRDKFTADGLKKATQSGHQAMSTVHAPSAVGIVERLADLGTSSTVMGSPDFLAGLVYQKLVPLLCEDCSELFSDILSKADVSEEDTELSVRLSKVSDHWGGGSGDVIRVKGRNRECKTCGGMGVKGRTVCAEIIAPDFELYDLFREQSQVKATKYWRGLASPDPDSSDMTGRTAAEHALFKMRKGLISPHDIEELFGPLDGLVYVPETKNHDHDHEAPVAGWKALPES